MPRGRKPLKLEARLYDKCTIVPESGCWLWNGSCSGYTEYGKIGVKGKTKLVHRVSYELHYGAIPKGLMVMHKCNVPSCVNPNHLIVGTHQQNMDDMTSQNRQGRSRGEKSALSKLTDAKVFLIRKDKRANIEIAQEYNVDPSTISRVKTKESWGHI